ncbi:MAG: thiamine pyrophosphate-dependent enzyme [Patescibacteria group bacterium]|jgi:2-oxoglutarate ferredoxin oxidoreductase subunit beta|nr:thiamine pyrophosphate-dependent enzyme [Patescibacteria group bacterium]MDD5173129.1 thiamine pyrophosphate-dependent enzyme [Patescibacteria group bacterium]
MSNKNIKLETSARNTWCPGCGNFGILASLKEAISEIINEGISKEEIVLVSGIGCGSKIIDYINLNSFSSLHGRSIISAEGIKMANPKLKVIAFTGDGGCYNEGIAHLIHAAKRNADITVLVHDNRNFALTTSQFTATSPKGFKGKSTPQGNIEEPFNPLELMFSLKTSFIARGYSMKINHLKDLIKKGIKHKGFSFIEILQPCITFFDNTDFYNQRVYEMKENDLKTDGEIIKKIKEWDYKNNNSKIPLGIFYQREGPTYEENLLK